MNDKIHLHVPDEDDDDPAPPRTPKGERMGFYSRPVDPEMHRRYRDAIVAALAGIGVLLAADWYRQSTKTNIQEPSRPESRYASEEDPALRRL